MNQNTLRENLINLFTKHNIDLSCIEISDDKVQCESLFTPITTKDIGDYNGLETVAVLWYNCTLDNIQEELFLINHTHNGYETFKVLPESWYLYFNQAITIFNNYVNNYYMAEFKQNCNMQALINYGMINYTKIDNLIASKIIRNEYIKLKQEFYNLKNLES